MMNKDLVTISEFSFTPSLVDLVLKYCKSSNQQGYLYMHEGLWMKKFAETTTEFE